MWFHLTEDDRQARSSDSLVDDAHWKFSAIILSVALGLWKSSGAIWSSIYSFLWSMTHVLTLTQVQIVSWPRSRTIPLYNESLACKLCEHASSSSLDLPCLCKNIARNPSSPRRSWPCWQKFQTKPLFFSLLNRSLNTNKAWAFFATLIRSLAVVR